MAIPSDFIRNILIGFAAGDYYKHAGGGVELLCLPKQPSWGNYSSSHIGHAYVYGTEFEIFGTNSDLLFGKQVGEQNVPCVVCQSAGRLVALRIPGRFSLRIPGRFILFDNSPYQLRLERKKNSLSHNFVTRKACISVHQQPA